MELSALQLCKKLLPGPRQRHCEQWGFDIESDSFGKRWRGATELKDTRRKKRKRIHVLPSNSCLIYSSAAALQEAQAELSLESILLQKHRPWSPGDPHPE